MILNLLNTMLITLGTGASVLNTPKKQIKPPINKAQEQFSLEIGQTWQGDTLIQSAASYQNTSVYNTYAQNTAIMVKGNLVINNNYGKVGNDYVAPFATTKTQDMNISQPYLMTIAQITPYNNVIDSQNNLKIHTLVSADSSIFLNTGNYQVEDLVFYATTYETNDDWSQYIDRNDYTSWNYIKNLRQEIESPENGYRYTKTEQYITSTNIGNYETEKDITTDINITKGLTTYLIQIIQPILKLVGEPQVEQIGLISDEYRCKNMLYRSARINRGYYITGNMIIAEGTTEIVDIPGLMFQVLTMPFTFISGAFNLTLFPGTPYQINIANLFMAIIAVMAFIFILKLLIGLKGGN